MFSTPIDRALRSLTGGLLVGYGFVSFFCFLLLEELWTRDAPAQPDIASGLIYAHNSHGSISYFSQFQATACALMFATSIPLALIGSFTAPKRVPVGGGISSRFAEDHQHWEPLAKWSSIAGAVGTPVFIYFVGPVIIGSLNAAGVIVNFG